MKLIKLNKGKFAQVDDEDYEYLNQFKWHYSEGRGGSTGYAKRGVNLGNKKTETISMHRIILGLKKHDGKIPDHIDGDGLNNQKVNLRIATIRQNGMNRKSWGASKYLGVFLIRRKPKNGIIFKPVWVAQIKLENKRKSLGQFPYTDEGEIAAAIAYNNAAIKRDPEFARLNII